jgi:hypothetical protein
MLQGFIRRRRTIARGLLVAFAAFWAVTAVAPCAMAGPCPTSACAGAHDPRVCPPLAQLDCQVSDPQVVKSQSIAPLDLTPVLSVLVYAAPRSGTDFAARCRPQRLAAEAIPRPSLVLQYAVLLI